MHPATKRRRTLISLAVAAALLAAMAMPMTAWAGVAYDGPIAFTQANGSPITITLRGDEFLNWTEDTQGNLITLVGDSYYYAYWGADGPVSTGALVTNTQSRFMPAQAATSGDNPSPIPQAVRAKAAAAREAARPAQTPADISGFAAPEADGADMDMGISPMSGISAMAGEVAPLSDLQRKVLVVNVTFAQPINNRAGTLAPFTSADAYNKIFGGSNSVNDYYKQVFGTSSNVIIPATELAPQGVYNLTLPKHPNTGGDSSAFADWMDDIVSTKLNLNAAALNALDTSKDGYLEPEELTVCFIVQGYEGSISSHAGDSVWGVANWYSGTPIKGTSMRIRNFTGFGSHMALNDFGQVQPSSTIGVMAHELGHAAYYFDDLYDYATAIDDGKSGGVGYWSLMASGNWAGKSGSSPAYVDAYNLTAQRLVSPEDLTYGAGTTHTASTARDIYRIKTPNSRQYFLLQNRRNEGYDAGMFNSIDAPPATLGGMLIYHVDNNVVWEMWGVNEKNNHHGVGIVEADGDNALQKVERAINANSGRISDLWGINWWGGNNLEYGQGRDFNGTTNPNSNLYGPFTLDTIQPSKTTPSRVGLSNINFNSGTKATTFTVDASSATVIDMSIKSQLDMLTYNEGSRWIFSYLSLRGLAVTLTYSDGTKVDIVADDFEDNGIITSPEDGEELTIALHHGKPVTVTHTASGKTATTANLTVTAESIENAEPPFFRKHPQSATVTSGSALTLNMEANGYDENGEYIEDGFDFQWYSNTRATSTGGTPIPGAISDTYTTPKLTTGVYYYYVTVTNTIPNNGDGGVKTATATSNVAIITVNENAVNAIAPTIYKQPEDVTVNQGEWAMLIIDGIGGFGDGGDITVQWYENATPSNAGGTPIDYAWKQHFYAPTDTPGTFYYYAVVTNTIPDNGDGGNKTATTTTRAVTVTVKANPTANTAQTPIITRQPQSVTVYRNNTATLSVTAHVTDGGTLSYQWYRGNNLPYGAGTVLSGATGASYNPPTSATGVYSYYVIVTNTRASSGTSYDAARTANVTSTTATVTVQYGSSADDPWYDDRYYNNNYNRVGYADTEALLSVSSAVFDKQRPGDLTITLSPGSYSLREIKSGYYTLVKDVDYTVSGNTYTIKASFLSSLWAGEHVIVFDMSGGTDPKLTVNVTDSAQQPAPQPVPVAAQPTRAWANPFADVRPGDWFYESVRNVNARGLFGGTSPDAFSPQMGMTRAMFTRALANLESAELSAYQTSGFSDVPDGQWYTSAVEWAANKGIVGGVGAGRFDPSASITREQMAAMLNNYLNFKGMSLPAVNTPAPFADESSVSAWAGNAVRLMQTSGIVGGKPGNMFDPKATATRAEVATIFSHFLDAVTP